MDKTSMTVNEYFLSLKDQDRKILETIRDIILSISPNVSESIWKGVFWGGTEQTILGFGEMIYQKPDKSDSEWFMIGISRQKNYFSIYVNAIKDNQYLVKSYSNKLGKTKVGSSSISFSKLENVDLNSLKDLFIEAIAIHNEGKGRRI